MAPNRRCCVQIQTLFCFLHLAANEALTHSLLVTGVTAIAFETLAEWWWFADSGTDE